MHATFGSALRWRQKNGAKPSMTRPQLPRRAGFVVWKHHRAVAALDSIWISRDRDQGEQMSS